jgi:ferredoxin
MAFRLLQCGIYSYGKLIQKMEKFAHQRYLWHEIGPWLKNATLRFLYDSARQPEYQILLGITDMNVSLDRGACVSCGACWNICPELFDQNPCDSFSEIVEDYRFNGDRAEGVVPDCLCWCAQEAADLCPVQIIRIC